MPSKLLLIFLLFFVIPSIGQKKNASYRYDMRRINLPMKIDGHEGDEAWKNVGVATDFWMVLPMDTSRAKGRTDVRMCYDDKNMYLLVEAYHVIDKNYQVESLKRDFAFGKNDNFLLFMDPYDDRTNGFSFGCNAAGGQWDGTMYDGGSVDLSWENKWTGVTKNYEDKWVFEAAIPFKSIRYKKGISEWGINFSRLDIRTTEKSSWTPIPRIFPTAALAYTGTLVWDQPPPDPGLNVSVIPYVLTGFSKNYTLQTKSKIRKEFGGDAKISISSALNLDLTINPDFSQVEVDQQVSNLDRFELFFPERRQFFLENGDLFANIGNSTLRPFFSRRIGLGIPIDFGARFSGKLDQNWRIGILDMQTRKNDLQPGYNFGMVALQRRVFSRSNITVFAINKQALAYDELSTDLKRTNTAYNRNLGFEYNLASANNRWTGKLMYARSLDAKKSSDAWSHVGNLKYATRTYSLQWQQEYVSKNYLAEVGYVPRKEYFKISPLVSYLFYPGAGKVLTHGPAMGVYAYFNPKLQTTDRTVYFMYTFSLRSQAKATFWLGDDWVKLLQPFDPTNTNKDTLARGTIHKWQSTGADFASAPQKLITYSLSYRVGGYYQEGNRTNFTTEIGYRFQPYVKLALSANYNNINLPAPWNRTVFWLVGPRVDVTFTNNLYFTSFVQYNEQINNLNINTRLQWRFKPASDIFLVYTDNYLPAPFNVKNRALVFKMNYWWNL